MKNNYSNIFTFNKKILKKTINNLDNDKIQLVINILNDMTDKNKTLLIVSHDSRIIDQIDSIKFKITDCLLENISND